MKITSFNHDTMHTLICIMRSTFPANFAIHNEVIQSIERGDCNGDSNAILAIHFLAVSIHRRLVIMPDGECMVGWSFNDGGFIHAMDSAKYRSMKTA